MALKYTAQKRRSRNFRGPSFLGALRVLAVVFLLVAVGLGFVWLDRHVRASSAVLHKPTTIELVDVPTWATEQLRERVRAAARVGRETLLINESTAVMVQHNIESQVAWIADVRVEVTHEAARVKGRWRKPLALLETGSSKFYIDTDLVILDSMPMPDLPIVTLSGLVASGRPVVGQTWRGEDLAAAIAILTRLERMDSAVASGKPLLPRIDRIDVANFRGRKSANKPHIILHTKDNTEIIWGAEIGAWQRHLEATDEEKLANLYAYYEQYGTFADVKYINLRDPQQAIRLPIDQY
jgi:hypothetical protein